MPRRAAVLGRPVSHSLSPALHRAAYAELDLTWTYDAIECDERQLPALLASAGPEWVGFSCTMPLKRTALALASSATERAAMAGAANTLLPRPDGWLADNTDVAGLLAALRERGVATQRVTVLGAGGTAQAAVTALAELGVSHCALLVRDLARTGDVRAGAERVGVRLEVGVLSPDADELGAQLIVSALPRGAADVVAAHRWRADQVLLDAVYDPWPTAAAAAMQRAGGTVVSGALLLLHQAVEQVELMTGRAAPVEAMRAALRAAAPGCGV